MGGGGSGGGNFLDPLNFFTESDTQSQQRESLEASTQLAQQEQQRLASQMKPEELLNYQYQLQQKYGPELAKTDFNTQMGLTQDYYNTYEPLFKQAALDSSRKFGPQELDLQNQLTRQSALNDFALRRELSPQDLDLQNQLTRQSALNELGLQREISPQQAELTRQYQESLNPELAVARKTLTDYLSQPDELSQYEKDKALEDVRGAQTARGFGRYSGMGADEELKALTDMRQKLKERRLNIALSTAGRAPISGGGGVSVNSGSGMSSQFGQLPTYSNFGNTQGYSNYNLPSISPVGSTNIMDKYGQNYENYYNRATGAYNAATGRADDLMNTINANEQGRKNTLYQTGGTILSMV